MRSLIFITVLTLGLRVVGQDQLFFNHYMFNPAFYNPAWVGSEPVSSVAFQYRSQWTGYSTSFDGAGGAPNSQLLSLAIPVMNFPISGLGINVSNDALGTLSDQQIQFTASMAKELRSGTLRLGVMPGIYSKTISQLRFNQADPLDPGAESQFRPSLTSGLFYQNTRKFSIGFSVMNIIQSSFDFSNDSINENLLVRSYLFHGSKSITFNEDITIVPSSIIRTDLTRVTFDISTMVFYKQKMWAGLSYRMEEALSLFLGYSLLKDNVLKVGYSFDYVIHDRDAKQATSNEILVRYNLPNLIFGGRKSIKTPRFAF